MLNILLAVDGSESSLAAVRHALRLVEGGLSASFVLANVQAPATVYEMLTAQDPEVLDKVSAGAGEHQLEAAAALLAAAGVPFEQEVASGEPGHVLAEMIERYAIDAVIMGAHRSGLTRSAVAGSAAQWLLAHTEVPVTVVRPVAAGEGEGVSEGE